MIKNSEFLNKLFIILLILLAGLFPYYHRLTSILIIGIVIVWIVNGGYFNLVESLKNKYVILFLLLFVIPFISLLYSDNKELGVLEKRLPLIIFPIILFTSNLEKKTIQLILYSFVFGCVIMSLYSFTRAILQPSLFGTELTRDTIGISHVYFGLYLSFSIILLLYFLLKKERHNYLSVVVALIIIYLLFFLIALGGKMSIISLMILILVFCVRIIVKNKQWFLGLLIIVIPLIIFFITINTFGNIRDRFYALFNSENYQVGDNFWNNIGSRITILECSYEIVKENPVLGTGIGDVQNELDVCNEISNFQTLEGMNSHNQYFQFLLGTGIVGMFYFLLTLGVSIKVAFRRRSGLYLSFLFLFMLCCPTQRNCF